MSGATAAKTRLKQKLTGCCDEKISSQRQRRRSIEYQARQTAGLGPTGGLMA
jgi:hypothetical protein